VLDAPGLEFVHAKTTSAFGAARDLSHGVFEFHERVQQGSRGAAFNLAQQNPFQQSDLAKMGPGFELFVKQFQ
jgi:hypothetical protein